MARETIAPATVQIIQPPEYSDDDLSGALPLLPHLSNLLWFCLAIAYQANIFFGLPTNALLALPLPHLSQEISVKLSCK